MSAQASACSVQHDARETRTSIRSESVTPPRHCKERSDAAILSDLHRDAHAPPAAPLSMTRRNQELLAIMGYHTAFASVQLSPAISNHTPLRHSEENPKDSTWEAHPVGKKILASQLTLLMLLPSVQSAPFLQNDCGLRSVSSQVSACSVQHDARETRSSCRSGSCPFCFASRPGSGRLFRSKHDRSPNFNIFASFLT